MGNFLNGYRTFLGVFVSLLGFLGVAKFFGGTDALTVFLDLLFQVLGLGYAAYGRYQATKIYK